MNNTSRVTVIAEAGVNHNGDVAIALDLIKAAFEAGSDFVKFQTFSTADIADRDSPKAGYQLRTTPKNETQFEMLRKLELTHEEHRILHECALNLGIGFISTPFDRRSLEFLLHDLELKTIKLPSSDLVNLPLLIDAGRANVTVFLSTGMADVSDVELALKALVFGALRPDSPGSLSDLHEAYFLPEAGAVLRERVTLLHCTSDYPADVADVNLLAMTTLEATFGLPVGYSDHTLGMTTAIAAVARGATVIEKHLTLDKSMEGPDHRASASPQEFASLVEGIRQVEASLGSARKIPTAREIENRRVMRKGLYASRDLVAGKVVKDADLRWMRPESSPGTEVYFNWLDKPAPFDVQGGGPLVPKEPY